MEIASREGTGVEALFDILGTETGKTRQVMEMDYERYAVGEALLGWVNIQGVLEAAEKGGKNGGKKSKGAKALRRCARKKSTNVIANPMVSYTVEHQSLASKNAPLHHP